MASILEMIFLFEEAISLYSIFFFMQMGIDEEDEDELFLGMVGYSPPRIEGFCSTVIPRYNGTRMGIVFY